MSDTPIRDADVAIVGAGPAGLALGRELSRAGLARVDVLDREEEAGGIPRHSRHTGFGLRDLHRVLSGPDYARHLVNDAVAAGATIRTGVTVTGWDGDRVLTTVSRDGCERVRASAVVLATGARERPRAARWVPGDRPRGIYTTGQLQQAVYQYGQAIGERAVIVGAEHVSYSAAVTLHHAGVRVAAMVTGQPRQQSYAAFHLAARLRYRFPVYTATRVSNLAGHGRLTAVEIERSGRVERIECDTVVFTGDWVSEYELARRGGLMMTRPGGLPRFDQTHASSVPGVFVAGNLGHPVETADAVAQEAAVVARHVLEYLANPAPSSDARVALDAGPGLRWVSPTALTPAAPVLQRDRIVAWADEFAEHPTWTVRQGGTTLWTRTRRARSIPNRPTYLPAEWIRRIDPSGPAVTVNVAGGRSLPASHPEKAPAPGAASGPAPRCGTGRARRGRALSGRR
jgi:NADPH-dependent 2,4-dienoyl-CoA reductase/sulfur reductase-like enzyme